MSIQCDRLEINGQFAIEFIEVSGRRVGPYRSSAAFTLPAHRASSAALVAEQVIHSYLDDHYRRALDDPLLGKFERSMAAETIDGARVKAA
jgi:hypothetical protein